MAKTTKTLTIDIGINGAFLTRRWENPDNWMRLTKECGYDYHSFCADVLDPFFSGDNAYQLETAEAAKEAAQKYRVEIIDIYTGIATQRFHGLSHSDARVRERMKEWMNGTFALAAKMGVDTVCGHVDAFSVETLADPARTEETWNRLMETMRSLSHEAKAKGLKNLYSEQMYMPSKVPWTLAQMERFLTECNRDNPQGVPVRVALDVGHVAGQHHGAKGEDLDYKVWLRRYAAQTGLVHLQQTTPDAAHHWPFTRMYNEKGYIDLSVVLEEIVDAHEEYHHSPVAPYLPPVDKVILVAELIPDSTKTERVVLNELCHTAEHLRHFIPEGGLKVTIGDD